MGALGLHILDAQCYHGLAAHAVQEQLAAMGVLRIQRVIVSCWHRLVAHAAHDLTSGAHCWTVGATGSGTAGLSAEGGAGWSYIALAHWVVWWSCALCELAYHTAGRTGCRLFQPWLETTDRI